MRDSRLHPSPIRWLLLLCATACLAFGTAFAAGVPVTDYVVIQPIDVCSTDGKVCAPFNTSSTNPNPDKATLSTPIGFVDTATNTNITRAIWLQAGIDVTFLQIARYNNTTYQGINDISCTTTCNSSLLQSLSLGNKTFPKADRNCSTACVDPVSDPNLVPTVAAANAIPMFFVNSITPAPGTTGTFYGFSWLNRSGITIASNTFFPSVSGQTPRYDTLAHEIGHALNLDHATFGAGLPPDVMTAGTNSLGQILRIVPTSTSNALTQLGGGGGTGTADQLILGNGSSTQQGEAVLSGLLNPVPNVTATAGGGAAAATTLATITPTITAAASSTTAITFNVKYPKLQQAGGRAGEFIMALIVALPPGDNFGTNPFIQTGGTAKVAQFELINGNNGNGNSNCLKPLDGGPSVKCLEIDFVKGTFTAGASVVFTSDIVTSGGQPVTSAEGVDLSYLFSDLFATTSSFEFVSGDLQANAQSPDATVASQIVDPQRFAAFGAPMSFAGFTQTPCTLTKGSTTCQPGMGGNPGVDDSGPMGLVEAADPVPKP